VLLNILLTNKHHNVCVLSPL